MPNKDIKQNNDRMKREKNGNSFYEKMAEVYDLFFYDWDDELIRQGRIIQTILEQAYGRRTFHVLDASCGIGTQALGLATLGHRVEARDLSAACVSRAAKEAKARGLELAFSVADMRSASPNTRSIFDAALLMDNSLAHLAHAADIQTCLGSLLEQLKLGGLLIVSGRDYRALKLEQPRFTSHRVVEGPLGRRVCFQIWDWGPVCEWYEMEQFLILETPETLTVQKFETRVYAHEIEEICAVMARVGFRDVRILEPEETGFYQPIVIARKTLSQPV